MVYVNDKYTIVGRSMAAKLNDIVNFDVYKFTYYYSLTKGRGYCKNR